MRLLLVVLTVALITLAAAPAQAQTAADDQYGSSGVGHDAANDAVTASSAFGDASDDEAAGSEDSAALAAENASAASDPESASVDQSAEGKAADSQEDVASHEDVAIEELPETGGISPLSLGILVVAGGLLIRTLTR